MAFNIRAINTNISATNLTISATKVNITAIKINILVTKARILVTKVVVSPVYLLTITLTIACFKALGLTTIHALCPAPMASSPNAGSTSEGLKMD